MFFFQRWKRRFFKLKGRKLYYAKDTKVNSAFVDCNIFLVLTYMHRQTGYYKKSPVELLF